MHHTQNVFLRTRNARYEYAMIANTFYGTVRYGTYVLAQEGIYLAYVLVEVRGDSVEK